MTSHSQKAKGLLLPVALVTLISGCGPFHQTTEQSPLQESPQGTITPQPTPQDSLPTPGPISPQMPTALKVAPLWEAARGPEGKSWTNFSVGLLLAEGQNMLKGTSDIETFCPTYQSLAASEKVNVWVYLISAIVKYESAFNPTSRMRENLGTDQVTHGPVYSEGLLQLSYQDKLAYPFCNEFNYSVDRTLSIKDVKRTILDPYINLRCGIRILNKLVGKHNAIAYDRGNYWSTLMPSRKPVHSIRSLVNQISICRR